MNTSPADIKIAELEKEIAQLKIDRDDMIAHKVYQAAYDKLLTIIKLFVAIAVIVMVAVGYQSYEQIVAAGSNRASEFFAKEAIPAITEKATQQATERVEQMVADFRVSMNAKADSQTAELVTQYKNKLDEVLKRVGGAEAVKQEAAGFVLYGEMKDAADTSAPSWAFRAFDLGDADPAAIPRVHAEAWSRIAFVGRDQWPAEASISWANATWGSAGGNIVATLPPGTTIVIRDVKIMSSRFVWVQMKSK